MAKFFYILVPFAILAVAIVLGLGLHNMLKGGDGWRSQRLMQLRVLLQAVAIIIIMAAIYFAHK
ncbi:twin transmembrane helix small protein [Labrys sp. KNU-23]|uniref:twin transmembrane helix small protein n=1 Tax=Labrys sp. KNU-23 TaxID=2789216 RepID=UPI0011EC42E7|nr:twin transmembrane helix small protein [Labrys sp. KNU-23]QEN88130.1 twin transmembrane helix small protein [Labrys sp. KNU-23]